jgi:hypothetical protein
MTVKRTTKPITYLQCVKDKTIPHMLRAEGLVELAFVRIEEERNRREDDDDPDLAEVDEFYGELNDLMWRIKAFNERHEGEDVG